MKKILITLVSVLIFAGLGFSFAEKKYEQPSFHTVIFATIVSADTDSSVSDKELSSQGLSETIIGWTYSPNFSQQLSFGISAKKQERQNIVFEFDAENPEISEKNAEKIELVLNQKLAQYNEASQTKFSFLFENPVISQNIPKKSMWSIAGAIVGLFVGASLGEIIFRRRGKNKK